MVRTAYSVVHSFMVYFTFYSFLFPLRDFEYPSNGEKINWRIFTFFNNLTESHLRKFHWENFTKILNKSVHHSWGAKKVLVLKTSKMLVLSFWGDVNFMKNKAEAVSGQFFIENNSPICYLYKQERTLLTQSLFEVSNNPIGVHSIIMFTETRGLAWGSCECKPSHIEYFN